MQCRQWVGLEGKHLRAEVKSPECVGIWGMQGARVSLRNSGRRFHVLGIWRCRGMLCSRARSSQEFWDGRSESMQQEYRCSGA